MNDSLEKLLCIIASVIVCYMGLGIGENWLFDICNVEHKLDGFKIRATNKQLTPIILFLVSNSALLLLACASSFSQIPAIIVLLF